MLLLPHQLHCSKKLQTVLIQICLLTSCPGAPVVPCHVAFRHADRRYGQSFRDPVYSASARFVGGGGGGLGV